MVFFFFFFAGYWVGPVSGNRLVSDHQCEYAHVLFDEMPETTSLHLFCFQSLVGAGIQENGRFDERLVQSGGQEVPGTLSSHKLSGFEIGELTQHLGNFKWLSIAIN